MDILPTRSSIDADTQDVEEQVAYMKSEELRRIKGKSKVWDKMTKFARRSRRYSVPEGACVPDADAAAMPQSADGMDYDPNPFHLSERSSAWFEGSSSSDGETTETLRMKKSRLYPNSEAIEQSSSMARAPFLQMDTGSSGRGGRPTKYGWQKKKRRAHHSVRCVDHVTGLINNSARSTSMPVDFTGGKKLGNPIPHQRHTSSVSLDSSFARNVYSAESQPFLTLPCQSPDDDMCVAMKTASLPNYHSHSFQKKCKQCGLILNTTHSSDNGVIVDGMSDMFAACFCQCAQQRMYKTSPYRENPRGCRSGIARSSYVAPVEFKSKLEVRTICYADL